MGSISPSFESGTNDYTVAAENSALSTTVTATASDNAASVTVNGVAVVSGAASSDVALDARVTLINVLVTAEDGATTELYTITVERAFASFELVDPTPGVSDEFGSEVVVLDNGLVVVNDPGDSSVATDNGAVHLFDPFSQTLVESFYGDQAGDQIGDDPVTVLSNGNFVIASRFDDDGGPPDAGAVRLIDGDTGLQIGPVETGNRLNDLYGAGGVIALPNGNYVISSPLEDALGVRNSGSTALIDGATGILIAPLVGSQFDGFLGNGGVVALSNGNYVVASGREDSGAVVDAGAVRLMNGETGQQIGVTLVGDQADDQLGGEGIVALNNGNFLIVSTADDDGPIVDAGSVRLVDGTTGQQIGAPLFGTDSIELLGTDDVVALPNGNYVVASSDFDDVGVPEAGSVRLFDGETGAQIGDTLVGDQARDLLGITGIVVLDNSNYVVLSSADDNGLLQNVGSVRLVDGSSGTQIGVVFGNSENDNLGSEGVVPLNNGNYVALSTNADDSLFNAGSAHLISGATGETISILSGGQENDFIGFPGATALDNGNYVISASFTDDGGLMNTGSVRLMNGSTGDQIGNAIVGDQADDFLGGDGTFALTDNSYAFLSVLDDDGLSADFGSLRRADGSSGNAIGEPIRGTSLLDFDLATISRPADGGYYLLAAPKWDNGSLSNSGLVRLFEL